MPPSCALLGGFAIDAWSLLLWQHSAKREMSASACTRSCASLEFSFYFNFCRFRAFAYTTLDKLWAVCLFLIFAVLLNWSIANSINFYSARTARIASAVLATAIPSVRPSVTRQYCVKTTARSTVQFAPLDSNMCLVLYEPKIFPRDDPFPLKFCLKVTYPLLKAASFDTFCLVAPQP